MVLKEDVLKIAKLARLQLNQEELEAARTKFSSILEHFKFLNEAPTEGVLPLFHAVDQMELREDEPMNPLPREALLKTAPEAFEESIKLPRVLP